MSSFSSTTTIILLLLFLTFSLSSPVPKTPNTQQQTKKSLTDDVKQPPKTAQKSPQLKTKPITEQPKNTTKSLKLKKTNSSSILTPKTTTIKPQNPTTKLNKTLNTTPKQSNTTKLLKPITKPTKPSNTNSATQSISKPQKPLKQPSKPQQQQPPPDYTSDFTVNFHDLLPDLERLSTSSKAYILEGVKPLIGHSTATKLAPFLSSALLATPLLLLAFIFKCLHPSHLALHRLLVFIQAYLAIYFTTLAFTAIATGLEPLQFLYSASPVSYTWIQAVQTLVYLVYLVVQLLDLVAVFSGDNEEVGGPEKLSGLVQMVIGLGVGVHYYVAVFYRAVKGEEPRANWRVHSIYATCFVVICWCARTHKRKKIYEGEDDGKKS